MKHFLNKCSRLLLLYLFCIGSVNAQQVCGDIALDDFSESSTTLFVATMNEPLIEAVDDGGSGVLGQFRNVRHEILEGPSIALLSIGSGILAVDNGSSVISRNNLLYSADGTGLNLDLATNDLANLTVFSVDFSVNITYVLTDESLNQATQTQTVIGRIMSGDDPVELEFLFDDFTGIDTVDLSAIDSVELILEPDMDSTDFSIGAAGFGCRGIPPSVAVPTLTGAGYVVLAFLVFLLAFFGMRKQTPNTISKNN